MDTSTNASRMKTVYTVVERGPNKSFWVKLGVGYVNRDGSINLRLDAVPVNGTLQVRDYEPYTDGERPRTDGPAVDEGERSRARKGRELTEALA
jgi:hypothetical protein